MKPGKTAALVALRGKGARRLRQAHFSVDRPVLPCKLTSGQSTLSISHVYRHMGAYTSARGDNAVEVGHRIKAHAS
eukprot:15432888-Alexandrium_andersonii.AAC.1